MASSCEHHVPYTLLGALLSGPPAAACGGVGRGAFFRDYAERGTNAMLWAALLAVTWLLVLRVAALLRLWALGARLPGPPAFPADPGLAAVCRGAGYLSKLHGSYGPVVRLWLGPSQLLVSVKDSRVIKELLTKAEDKLPLTGKTYNLACGKLGLFISSFEKVKSRRESLKSFLDEKLSVGASGSSFKIIQIILDRIDSITARDFLDCRSFSQHMAFNVVGSALFGDAFFDWSDASAYEELMMTVAKDACFWASYAVSPFWKPDYRRYRTLCAQLKILTQGIVAKSRNQNGVLSLIDMSSCQRSERGIKDPCRGVSLLDGVISSRCLNEAAEGALSSEEEICGNIIGLMLHGISTCANLIGNILTRLALYANFQCQLHSEIVAGCHESSELKIDDVLRMKFLLATVCESARLLPAGPLLQRCSLQQDVSLNSSITIPAGAILVIPLHLVQMDASTWGNDACQFNPNRFLKKDINFEDILAAVHKGSNGINLFTEECDKTESFLPFGSGSRACVGQKFAVLGIAMLIASLLRSYELWIQPEQKQFCPAFNNLKKLYILCVYVEFDLLWAINLLEAAPSVELLFIDTWKHVCLVDQMDEEGRKGYLLRKNTSFMGDIRVYWH
uniref:Cytochrome P450 n=1 Tax=Oryza punctata TaxID=4537 RepID=A0A0E0LP14_ORYPU